LVIKNDKDKSVAMISTSQPIDIVTDIIHITSFLSWQTMSSLQKIIKNKFYRNGTDISKIASILNRIDIINRAFEDVDQKEDNAISRQNLVDRRMTGLLLFKYLARRLAGKFPLSLFDLDENAKWVKRLDIMARYFQDQRIINNQLWGYWWHRNMFNFREKIKIDDKWTEKKKVVYGKVPFKEEIKTDI
jgi:hypothetical protein